MGAVMDGEATQAQLAALLVALRMRGETVDELAGFASAMRERVAPRRCAARRDRRRRHRRRPERDVQRLDDRGPRRRRQRACRWPSTATGRSRRGPAPPTSSTRSASGSTMTPASAGRRPARASASRSCSRRASTRRCGTPGRPAGDRRPDRVQPDRPAHEPGQRLAAARRDRRPGRRAEARGGPPALGAERAFVVHGAGRRRAAARRQRGPPRRDPGRRRASRRSTPRHWARPRRRRAGWPAGRLPRTRAIVEAILRGEPGARRDVVLLNAGAALVVAGAAATLEEGIERAGLTIDAGLAKDLLATLRAERRTAEAARPVSEGTPA